MKTLSITLGASVLACNNGPCATSTTQTNFGVGVNQPIFQQSVSTQPWASQHWGDSLSGRFDVSPFSSNKPWHGGQVQSGQSQPSSWQNSPSSVWTQAQSPAFVPANPRPTNPSLAGRSPSEQLQITKCRSAQTCEKCRQLNCYWDSTGKITNRCIALGLESTQIPVEAGQPQNLGYCPRTGQQGFMGVNWLAIENSGAAVPNLDGMSDAAVQQWLSSIPNYNPDATDSNYPAGTAFKELLPTASKAYADGKIPSTTPWISFFDSLNAGYSYDGYSYDSGYTYDLPSDFSGFSGFGASGLGASGFGPSGVGAVGFGPWEFGSSGLGSSGFGAASGFGGWDSSSSFQGSFGSVYPTAPAFSGSLSIPSFPSASSCCGGNVNLPPSQFSGPSMLGASLSQPLGFGAQFSQVSQPFGFGQPVSSQPALGPAWSG